MFSLRYSRVFKINYNIVIASYFRLPDLKVLLPFVSWKLCRKAKNKVIKLIFFMLLIVLFILKIDQENSCLDVYTVLYFLQTALQFRSFLS
jgi:hypothetical protein